jgi:hypothetical protein
MLHIHNSESENTCSYNSLGKHCQIMFLRTFGGRRPPTGTKTLAAAFFVADVEGNYSLILGRDWIHANQCIPSTLHQMLIQWVGDDVEQVHADVSAYIAVADAPVLWTYETATCLTGVDFSDYQFISIDKRGFIPIMLEPMENRLNPK